MDPVCGRSGVTAVADAGSTGAHNFEGFRRWVLDSNRTRTLAFLNISSIGLTASTWEVANPNYLNVKLAVKMASANRDVVRGIKVRLDANTTGTTGILGMDRAREAAEELDLPIM